MSISAGNRIFLGTLQTPKACDSYRLLNLSYHNTLRCFVHNKRKFRAYLLGCSLALNQLVLWYPYSLGYFRCESGATGNSLSLPHMNFLPPYIMSNTKHALWFCLPVREALNLPPVDSDSFIRNAEFQKISQMLQNKEDYEKSFEIDEACIILLS